MPKKAASFFPNHSIKSDQSLMNKLAVVALNDHSISGAKHYAHTLELPLYEGQQELKLITEYDYLLLVDGDCLSVGKTGKKAPAPVMVNFTEGAAAHRRQYGGGKSQDIAKAIGLNKRSNLSVFDATAGLGGDAFVLATLGCQVTMFERMPFVSALLASGLARAKDSLEIDEIITRMELIPYSLQEWQQKNDEKADVVYLDPMFPHTDKSAAAKKEMAFFRDLVGSDADADSLLEIAYLSARYRVVVKRPKGAPYLNDQSPTYQLLGKSGRFDIYVLQSLDKL